MRSTSDRLRHAISFELIGLAVAIPFGAWAFGKPVGDIGVIGVGGVVIATVWTYIFNLGFDITLRRVTGRTRKSIFIRALHAVLFEAGLLAVLMPFFAWYLRVGLYNAFLMNVSFALFYMAYAFVFNWVYDRIFPLPGWENGTAPRHAVP